MTRPNSSPALTPARQPEEQPASARPPMPPSFSAVFSVPFFRAISSFASRPSAADRSGPAPAAKTRTPSPEPDSPPVDLAGYPPGLDQTERLLGKDPDVAEDVRGRLPGRHKITRQWDLVYSLAADGSSLATAYRHCRAAADYGLGVDGGYVVVVKDTTGNLFGAYVTDPPILSSRAVGGTKSFLWKAPKAKRLLQEVDNGKDGRGEADRMHVLAEKSDPAAAETPAAAEAVLLDAAENAMSGLPPQAANRRRRQFKAFPATGENANVLICRPKYICFGAGDGRFGLSLDASFEHGSSGGCSTFANETLVGFFEGDAEYSPEDSENNKSDRFASVSFDIVAVEFWRVGRLKPGWRRYIV